MKILLLSADCRAQSWPSKDVWVRLEHFRRDGAKHILEGMWDGGVEARAAENAFCSPSHEHLRKGVVFARTAGIEIDWRIVSAGFGLLKHTDQILPYAFGIAKRTLRDDLAFLETLRREVREALESSYDLGLVLLSEPYLRAIYQVEAGLWDGRVLGIGVAAAPGWLPGVSWVEAGAGLRARLGCGFGLLYGVAGQRVLEWPIVGSIEPLEAARAALEE